MAPGSRLTAWRVRAFPLMTLLSLAPENKPQLRQLWVANVGQLDGQESDSTDNSNRDEDQGSNYTRTTAIHIKVWEATCRSVREQ